MDDDERFSALFHGVVGTLDPPTERLVDGGIARGRRRMRLVRGAEALSAVAVAAGVAALVVALVPDGRADHTTTSVGSTRPVPSVSAQPSTSTATGAATVAMTPQALLRTTIDRLPRPGKTSHYDGRGSVGFAGSEFVYDDGHGRAQIDVALEYGAGSETITDICLNSHCTTRPDGSRVATYRGYEYPADPSRGARNWSVWVGRPDGVLVSLSEWNSSQEKDAPITRPLPPFTIAELVAIADTPKFAAQVPSARAQAAQHLFTPDAPDPGLQTSPTSTATSSVDPAQARKMCKLAERLKKSAPAYCRKFR